jgi:ATP-dependent helicase HrpB
LASTFPEAPFLSIAAPSYPVKTAWLERPDSRRCWQVAAEAASRALKNHSGDILVFLPGEPEIRRTDAALQGALPNNVRVRPLYGALSRADQDAAIMPSPPGLRKVVLASAIAESSLTIEGVTVVIDTGWMRINEYSPHWGMNRLETRRVSRDRADQRRGRAGRTAPGVCLRLCHILSKCSHVQHTTACAD